MRTEYVLNDNDELKPKSKLIKFLEPKSLVFSVRSNILNRLSIPEMNHIYDYNMKFLVSNLFNRGSITY